MAHSVIVVKKKFLLKTRTFNARNRSLQEVQAEVRHGRVTGGL